MVVMVGGIAAETCFRRKVRIGSRSYCLIGKASRSLEILLIVVGGKDEQTLGLEGV